jgi:hypothetical protein
MQRIKITGLTLVAVLAMSGVWAGSASAAARKITLVEPIAGELEHGEAVEAEYMVSFKTMLGTDECTVVASDTVGANDAKNATLKAGEETGSTCTGTGSPGWNFDPAPYVAFSFGANGKATVTLGRWGEAPDNRFGRCLYEVTRLKGHNSRTGLLQVTASGKSMALPHGCVGTALEPKESGTAEVHVISLNAYGPNGDELEVKDS